MLKCVLILFGIRGVKRRCRAEVGRVSTAVQRNWVCSPPDSQPALHSYKGWAIPAVQTHYVSHTAVHIWGMEWLQQQMVQGHNCNLTCHGLFQSRGIGTAPSHAPSNVDINITYKPLSAEFRNLCTYIVSEVRSETHTTEAHCYDRYSGIPPLFSGHPWEMAFWLYTEVAGFLIQGLS